MYKFSINKDLFDNILLKKIRILEKENTNYWKKELLEPIIIDDKLNPIYNMSNINMKVTYGVSLEELIEKYKKKEKEK